MEKARAAFGVFRQGGAEPAGEGVAGARFLTARLSACRRPGYESDDG